MKILITAGGTSEKIDEVRKIDNIATGRLGSLTADAFLNREDADVTYVSSAGACMPQNKRAEILYVDDVRSLKLTLEQLLRERTFDAVVHSMAVSDYSVKYNASSDELARFLSESLSEKQTNFEDREQLSLQIRLALSAYAGRNSAKISSDVEQLFLCLEKTPKVIGIFKKLQPDAVLVGFKLLAGTEESDLLLAAKKLMDTNQCDFVLANDKREIGGDRHAGILIGADQSVRRLHTKPEIADAIVKCVVQKVERKHET
jgi:Phosphopantothenoylcysteine synthetase/decarboxylase